MQDGGRGLGHPGSIFPLLWEGAGRPGHLGTHTEAVHGRESRRTAGPSQKAWDALRQAGYAPPQGQKTALQGQDTPPGRQDTPHKGKKPPQGQDTRRGRQDTRHAGRQDTPPQGKKTTPEGQDTPQKAEYPQEGRIPPNKGRRPPQKDRIPPHKGRTPLERQDTT